MAAPVSVTPMRMSSLIISSALAAWSPIANGMITHIATSASKAPNLNKLRFAFFCFIFITFLLPLESIRTVHEKRVSPNSVPHQYSADDEAGKTGDEIKKPTRIESDFSFHENF